MTCYLPLTDNYASSVSAVLNAAVPGVWFEVYKWNGRVTLVTTRFNEEHLLSALSSHGYVCTAMPHTSHGMVQYLVTHKVKQS